VNDLVSQASFPLLAGATTLALIALNALWSAVGVCVERSRFGRAHRVWAIELAPRQVRREIAANLRFDVIVGVSTAALLSSGAVRTGATGAAAAALTFLVCWVVFEIYYWLLHRAMHTHALYRFHRFHHDSRVTTPFTGVSTSAVEALGWALGFGLAPLLVSLIAPVSLTGWALYFLYNYSGNIMGHVNVEFLPRFLQRKANSWLMHPIVYHALHHARFVNHYSFGSSFMDRLLGTEWEDWPALHERVRSGRPMTKLAQRGV
jgi:sterol desaturase/sphingolipid hydroxylase (fatty acid hydroxylase superfamily)